MNRISKILCMALAVLMLCIPLTVDASAKSGTIQSQIGWVTADALRLRSGPSSSTDTVAYAQRDEVVVVTEKVGAWYKVIYNLTEGYMHGSYLNTLRAENVELGYGAVTGSGVNLRTGPGTAYRSIVKADLGDKAYIIGFNTGWYKVIYGQTIAYIRSDYLELTEVPYENRASEKEPLFFRNGKSTGVTPSAAALSGSGTGSTRQAIVDTAKLYLGTPYVWGGTTPSGFDCSGFTQYVLKQHGITIPRTTTEQYKVGTYVAKSDLQPGDLVFLQNTYRAGISHVGIYIGNGKMIHASSSKGVVISDLSSSYYMKHYYGARRVV